MSVRRTAYAISQSQVETPARVVSLFWDLTRLHRDRLGCVLDMGAGDCRFAKGGLFERYVAWKSTRSASSLLDHQREEELSRAACSSTRVVTTMRALGTHLMPDTTTSRAGGKIALRLA